MDLESGLQSQVHSWPENAACSHSGFPPLSPNLRATGRHTVFIPHSIYGGGGVGNVRHSPLATAGEVGELEGLLPVLREMGRQMLDKGVYRGCTGVPFRGVPVTRP